VWPRIIFKYADLGSCRYSSWGDGWVEGLGNHLLPLFIKVTQMPSMGHRQAAFAPLFVIEHLPTLHSSAWLCLHSSAWLCLHSSAWLCSPSGAAERWCPCGKVYPFFKHSQSAKSPPIFFSQPPLVGSHSLDDHGISWRWRIQYQIQIVLWVRSLCELVSLMRATLDS
jgi:hypothetical protein